MDGLTLLAEAQAAGLTVKIEGSRLLIRGPKRAEPLVRRLIEHKAEILAVVQAPGGAPALQLHPETVREVCGPSPAPDALQAVEAEVKAALAQVEAEVRTGRLARGPILVRAVPLGLWLPLDHVAALLRGSARQREGQERRRSEGAAR